MPQQIIKKLNPDGRIKMKGRMKTIALPSDPMSKVMYYCQIKDK
jgi:hypothetical protein